MSPQQNKTARPALPYWLAPTIYCGGSSSSFSLQNHASSIQYPPSPLRPRVLVFSPHRRWGFHTNSNKRPHLSKTFSPRHRRRFFEIFSHIYPLGSDCILVSHINLLPAYSVIFRTTYACPVFLILNRQKIIVNPKSMPTTHLRRLTLNSQKSYLTYWPRHIIIVVYVPL